MFTRMVAEDEPGTTPHFDACIAAPLDSDSERSPVIGGIFIETGNNPVGTRQDVETIRLH